MFVKRIVIMTTEEANCSWFTVFAGNVVVVRRMTNALF